MSLHGKRPLKIPTRLDATFPRGSLRQRYLGGASWIMLGTGLAQAATFIALTVAARLLGTAEFGEFGIVRSTLAIFGLFAGLGMGLTNKKYVGELREKDPVRCGRIIGFSSVVSLISGGGLATMLFFLAPYLATSVLNAPHLYLEIRIAAGLLLLNALNEVQIGALMGLEAFGPLTGVYAFRSVLTLVAVVAGVWLWAVSGLLLGMAITAFFVWLLSAVVLRVTARRMGIPIVYRNVWCESSLLWRFTSPALASGFLPAVVFWAAKAVTVRQPNGYSALGVFTVAEQWLVVVVFFARSLNAVGLPIISNVYASRDWGRFRRLTFASILLPVGLTIGVAIVVIVAAPWITGIYGEAFAGLTPVLSLLCIVGVFSVFGGSIGNFLASMDQMWWSFLFNVIWGGVLVLTALLLADHGAQGLALAYLTAYVVLSAVGGLYFLRKVQSTKSLWLMESATMS